MKSDDLKIIESQRGGLLEQLTAAEGALRTGLHTHGFGSTTCDHMERAIAHIREAYIAVNESKEIRSVQQLTNDLDRIQQVMDSAKRGQSQRI